MVDGLIFDRAAEAYLTGRPGYPAETFDVLTRRCGLGAGSRVLEIGAGPGQATLGLLERGASVTAVEPGPNMARILGERFADRALTVEVGRFEDVELPATAFDLAVSATAFHWVDHTVGLPKVRAALRPGGWFALLFNRFYDPDEPADFNVAVQPVIDRYLPDYRGSLGLVGGENPWPRRMSDAGFVGIDSTSVRWERVESTDEVVARFLTHSGPLTLGDADRAELAADLRSLCGERFGGRVHQRYLTVVELAQRPA